MTQLKKILKILEEKGEKGMNSYEYRMQFIQLPARIWDLKQLGYKITEKNNQDRSVNYILEAKIRQEPEYVFIGNKGYRKEDLKPEQLTI